MAGRGNPSFFLPAYFKKAVLLHISLLVGIEIWISLYLNNSRKTSHIILTLPTFNHFCKLSIYLLFNLQKFIQVLFTNAEVSCDWSGTFDENTWSCCSVTNKCKEKEGDCDSNDQCEGDLICGFNNCQNNFDPLADCCTIKTDRAGGILGTKRVMPRQIFGLNRTKILPKSLEISTSKGALFLPFD